MMNAKCGACGGTHETIAEYRDCAGVKQEPIDVMDNLTGVKTVINPPSTKQVSYALDLLGKKVWPDSFTEEDLKGMERRQVSDLIDGLFKAPRKPSEFGAKGSKPVDKWEDIPDGRYALAFAPSDGPAVGDEAEWRFFQIKHGHTRVFVDLLIGAPGAYRYQKFYGVQADKILGMIRSDTPRVASINFGLKSETCGVCSSPLTNPDSIKYGIGPICRGKMGW